MLLTMTCLDCTRIRSSATYFSPQFDILSTDKVNQLHATAGTLSAVVMCAETVLCLCDFESNLVEYYSVVIVKCSEIEVQMVQKTCNMKFLTSWYDLVLLLSHKFINR